MTTSRRSQLGTMVLVLALTGSMLLLLPGVASAQSPGPSNTITDVAGIEVGHYDRYGDGWRTGTTVVLTEPGATASYSSMGGGPGTKETDLLKPGGLVTEAHAVVLSGGSAYGLDASTGVMRWLEERGSGYPVGRGVVPIVPSAILFDLGRGGDWDARPDAEFGYRAADAASGDPVPMGRVGAGMGARHGLGSASVTLANGYTVGAIVGLNPGGSPIDPDTCLPYGAFLELDDEFNLAKPSQEDCPQAYESTTPEDFNTTIAVVATDAPLDQTQAQRMAEISNSGLSRSIRPVHNLGDGDTVFSLATTTPPSHSLSNNELQQIYNGAADALGRAVVHTMLEAETLGNSRSYCDTYPSVCQYFSGEGAYSAEYCKDGGWRNFTNPTYPNQGQCVQDAGSQDVASASSDDEAVAAGFAAPTSGSAAAAAATTGAADRTLYGIATALLLCTALGLAVATRRLRPVRLASMVLRLLR